jgi:uncharacterized protein (DUF433 family)
VHPRAKIPGRAVAGLLAAGASRDQILADYTYIEPEDIDEALQHAALLAEDEYTLKWPVSHGLAL